jgi:hypothetical protein
MGDDGGDAGRAPKSRRRIAWRKGADVDQELWPAEAFGGVSDEQFWDDLAADKPLATIARTAQPDSAARRRPNAGPLPDLYPRDDRTAMHPVQSGTQPSAVTAQLPPVPAQLPPVAAQLPPVPAPAYPAATQASSIATQPARAAHQPAESRGRSRGDSGGFPASGIGASGVGPDEDPLTSPKYSLRPKARSHQSSRGPDFTREQYEAATTQETQTFSLAEAQAATGGYPGGVPPFRQFDQPARGNGPARSDSPRSDPLAPDGYRTYRSGSGDGQGTAPYAAHQYPQQTRTGPTQAVHTANTPPYGEMYGYGNPVGRDSQVSDPRRMNDGRANDGRANDGRANDGRANDGRANDGRANDGRANDGRANDGQSPRRAGGDASRDSRPAYPPADGYRGPHDPREHDPREHRRHDHDHRGNGRR